MSDEKRPPITRRHHPYSRASGVVVMFAQPAFQAGDARNAAECESHGLKPF